MLKSLKFQTEGKKEKNILSPQAGSLSIHTRYVNSSIAFVCISIEIPYIYLFSFPDIQAYGPISFC